MALQYRTNNKQLLKDIHDCLFENADDPEYCWQFIQRYLYLDDLYAYSVAIMNGNEVERGIGNLNSKIMFVLETLRGGKDYIDLFKKVFKDINMDFNAVYFTSYNKAEGGTKEKFDTIMTLEINDISPSVVVSVGDYGIKPTDKMDVIIIPPEILDNIIRINKLEEQSKDPLTEDQKKDLQTNKRELWNLIKPIIKYYE